MYQCTNEAMDKMAFETPQGAFDMRRSSLWSEDQMLTRTSGQVALSFVSAYLYQPIREVLDADWQGFRSENDTHQIINVYMQKRGVKIICAGLVFQCFWLTIIVQRWHKSSNYYQYVFAWFFKQNGKKNDTQYYNHMICSSALSSLIAIDSNTLCNSIIQIHLWQTSKPNNREGFFTHSKITGISHMKIYPSSLSTFNFQKKSVFLPWSIIGVLDHRQLARSPSSII